MKMHGSPVCRTGFGRSTAREVVVRDYYTIYLQFAAPWSDDRSQIVLAVSVDSACSHNAIGREIWFGGTSAMWRPGGHRLGWRSADLPVGLLGTWSLKSLMDRNELRKIPGAAGQAHRSSRSFRSGAWTGRDVLSRHQVHTSPRRPCTSAG